MIHDNNYAAGKTTAHDLINVHDMGKSISGLIMGESQQTQELSAHTGRNTVSDDSWSFIYSTHTLPV